MQIFTKKWWKAAGIRALKTTCQTAVTLFGGQAVVTSLGDGSPIAQVSWLAIGSASLMAGVISMLTSIAGLPEVTDDGEEDTNA